MIPETFRNTSTSRDRRRPATPPAWDLRPDGPVTHGSHALVIPVTRHGTPLVLRVNAHIEALRFWTVAARPVDSDAAGVMLLERLDTHH